MYRQLTSFSTIKTGARTPTISSCLRSPLRSLISKTSLIVFGNALAPVAYFDDIREVFTVIGNGTQALVVLVQFLDHFMQLQNKEDQCDRGGHSFIVPADFRVLLLRACLGNVQP